MRELHPWTGQVTVRVLDPMTGEERSRVAFPNLITDAGLNLLRDALKDGVDARIRYLALGAGSSSPSPGDTELEDERWRAEVAQRTAIGTGQLDTVVYVPPGEANNFVIEEIGWFAGSDAGASADSGTLLARVSHSHDKSNLESLQIDRLDTIGESA